MRSSPPPLPLPPLHRSRSASRHAVHALTGGSDVSLPLQSMPWCVFPDMCSDASACASGLRVDRLPPDGRLRRLRSVNVANKRRKTVSETRRESVTSQLLKSASGRRPSGQHVKPLRFA